MGQSQRRIEEGGFAGGGVKGRGFLCSPVSSDFIKDTSRAFVIDLFMTEQTGLMSNVFQSTKHTSLHNGLLSRSS